MVALLKLKRLGEYRGANLVRVVRWLAIVALHGNRLLQHFRYGLAGGAIGEGHA